MWVEGQPKQHQLTKDKTMRFNVQHIVKRAAIIMASVSTAVACFGQGQIQFLTFNVDPLKGKVLNGTTPLDSTYFGQLLGGASASSLSPIGSAVAFLSGGGAGYINGPTVGIPGTFGGDAYFYALAAWSSVGGTITTYAAALANRASLLTDSNTVPITLGGTPAGGGTPLTPQNANGFNNFSLVPEPSTVVLGFLGAAALLLRRRR